MGMGTVNVPGAAYTHPTGPGFNHIPAGGESGKILRWSANGEAAWGDDTSGEDLSRLTTNEKTSLVGAINEIVSFSIALKEGTGAGLHNSLYRGKYLGDHVTSEQWEAIQAGTFDDLWIGDYWTIGGVNWRIADFDYFLNRGYGYVPCTDHHIVIVPEQTLYKAKMNDTDTVTGAYVGSKMHTTNLAQAKTTINNAFGSAHILSYSLHLENSVNNGVPNSGSWYTVTVELMSERMVYGARVAGAVTQNPCSNASMLSLFRLRPDTIHILGTNWWVRDVLSGMFFVRIANGIPVSQTPSLMEDVRPFFCIYQAAA